MPWANSSASILFSMRSLSGAACASVHKDACRLEHIGGDPMRLQQSMQPDSVPTSLEAARHVHGAAQLGRGYRPELSDQLE
jgi:hypothetical protein